MDMTVEERKERLKQQRAKDKNHRYVNNDHLILKSGFIEKKVVCVPLMLLALVTFYTTHSAGLVRTQSYVPVD
jgi:hypothetical protein